MPDRILDFSRNPVRLRSRLKQLIVHPDDGPPVSIPFEEVAVILVSHPQVTFSQSVLEELSRNGGVLVACNRKSLPVAMLVPLASHHASSKRLRLQAAASGPQQKKAWQHIVKAKIIAQSQLLISLFGNDSGLSRMALAVKSGDTENLEAQAAKRYWKKLFEGFDFRRKPEGEDPVNSRLNFGYGVLRGIVARAICACGFHPSLGLHHHNMFNAYCLADDLMEPFRPIIDRTVRRQCETTPLEDSLTQETKEELIESLFGRIMLGNELLSIFELLARLSISLVQFYAKERANLELPVKFDIQAEKMPF